MKGLALCPVDGHGEAESKRQLVAEQLEGVIALGGGTINPGDEMRVHRMARPRKSSAHPPSGFRGLDRCDLGMHCQYLRI